MRTMVFHTLAKPLAQLKTLLAVLHCSCIPLMIQAYKGKGNWNKPWYYTCTGDVTWYNNKSPAVSGGRERIIRE